MRHHLHEVLALTVGLALSLTVAWTAWEWETEERAQRLHDDMAVYSQALEQKLESLVTAVRALAQFYSASDEVRADEFELFTHPFLDRNPSIRALEWVPQVQAPERAAFEAQVRTEGPADFVISEQSGAALVPAGPRPTYYPVWRVLPLAGNARATGFDVASELRRRAALEEARDRGQAVATAPLTLVQATANQPPGILVFMPAARGGTSGDTLEDRRQHLLGFAVGVVSPDDLLEEVIAALPPRGLDLLLVDASLPGAAGLLHAHASRGRLPESALDPLTLLRETPAAETWLAVADRVLVLRAFPVAGLYDQSRHWSLLLGGTGFVISVALSALLAARRRAMARLREREKLFGLFMDHSPTVAWIKDAQGRWVYLSKTFEQCFGLSLEDHQGKTDHDIWPPELATRFVTDDQRVLTEGRPLAIDEAVATADGEVRYWNTVKFLFCGENGRRYVGGIGMDVTERKQTELQLEAALGEARMARVDALTGIANRAGFEERLELAFVQARGQGGRFALILLDLDGFKAINDTHGHLVGDEVLKDVARGLAQHCRPEDLAGRCGGDEFALILLDPPDHADVLAVAERVRDAIGDLNWRGASVSASVGVALYPDHAEDLLKLIHVADLAMYAAKAAGKNCVMLAPLP